MSGGLGRALGGYDEMVFRTLVRDDEYIFHVVGLESEGTAADFQTGANSYLYGTRFMTWLCYAYGPDKLMQWVTRGENTSRYFGARFRQVYGMGMETAWEKWIAEERRFQEGNLAEIRKYPVTQAAASYQAGARVGFALLLRSQRSRALCRDPLSRSTWPVSPRFISIPVESKNSKTSRVPRCTT